MGEGLGPSLQVPLCPDTLSAACLSVSFSRVCLWHSRCTKASLAGPHSGWVWPNPGPSQPAWPAPLPPAREALDPARIQQHAVFT